MAIGTILLVSAGVAATAAVYANNLRTRTRRESHIRAYMFPRGLFEKFAQARPNLDLKHQQLVARALRQFFLAHLKSGCKRVAMPSQVADDLWHEFILFTRDYAHFCNLAFGQFLHHTPAVRFGPVRVDNEGLRRVWWYCCLEENINPRRPTRLPLLFALDRKLGIENGFVYQLDCGRTPEQAQAGCSSGGQCISHFSDPAVDGTTDGLGCSSGDTSGGDGAGGCSGGCGGD